MILERGANRMFSQGKENTQKKTEIDSEWVNLMLIARELGISIESIKAFLQQNYSRATATAE